MLRVSAELCVGCGACLESCRVGAISLRDDRAAIDQDICIQCGDCIDACPQGAISWVDAEIVESALLAPQSKPEVIRIPQPRLTTKQRWLAVAGGALSFLAREIAPRAADWLLDQWDRRQALDRGPDTTVAKTTATGTRVTTTSRDATPAGGHRSRHRHGRGTRQ